MGLEIPRLVCPVLYELWSDGVCTGRTQAGEVSGPASKFVRASTGVGREGQGASPPWILKLLQKKLFFQFRWVKNKFHHFWPRPEKRFGKIPTAPPWKKTFRRPWIHHALRLECEKSKGIDSFFPKHFDTVANLSLDVVRWITTTEMKSAQV